MIYRNLDITNYRTKRGTNDSEQLGLEDIIDFCIDNVSPQDVLLELGCYLGTSTAIFAHYAKLVISVDSNIRSDTIQYLAQFPNVLLIQYDSRKLFNIFKNVFYDVLYVDTLHTYKHFTQEVTSILSLAKPNAKIGGHDYSLADVRKGIVNIFGKPPKKVYKYYSWIM